MKISIIDIGSNSVRLATISDGKTLYKRMKTTRLGEGLAVSGCLNPEAMTRTAEAVAEFARQAKEDGAEKVCAFATAAVRSSANGKDFVSLVKEKYGLTVDVLDGDTEALCGITGALKGKDGGIIDVGGASCEVALSQNGKVNYFKSVDIGTVRLKDLAGRDREKLQKVIKEKIVGFGDISAENLKIHAIGGTATRLAAIKHGIKEYTPEITDGTFLSLEELDELSKMLLTLPVEVIRQTTICTKSADVVGGGCLLLLSVAEKLGVSGVTVSESDNLEGYAALKGVK